MRIPPDEARTLTMGKSTLLAGAAVLVCFAHSNFGVASIVHRMNLPGPKIAPVDFLDKYDHKLRQFAELFANSSTGRLLREVVEDLAAHPAKKFGVHIGSAAAVRRPVYYPEHVPVFKGNSLAISEVL
ncbi:conserved hypothetical protein [Neospora caninum Liverpool]|uniref:Uncharacterized protein n=1 Tax=Neospora caninum (strain Liverpool) TaxID=572307 RepID=F0V9K0_NEOCL|nr:conserved hypothetical protein [Neospora caninum Liverpool]CBZ50426.1 conserved hypothetical protein [Neospora caninum Liverpool]CEL65034.1 TPA: hypothetical protein BN1204_008950 [Neospora caninum Liverpool]|eukprot:XP_003880459.1 conserved hypothetical protein [Neospora caninum Liverpool]